MLVSIILVFKGFLKFRVPFHFEYGKGRLDGKNTHIVPKYVSCSRRAGGVKNMYINYVRLDL